MGGIRGSTASAAIVVLIALVSAGADEPAESVEWRIASSAIDEYIDEVLGDPGRELVRKTLRSGYSLETLKRAYDENGSATTELEVKVLPYTFEDLIESVEEPENNAASDYLKMFRTVEESDHSYKDETGAIVLGRLELAQRKAYCRFPVGIYHPYHEGASISASFAISEYAKSLPAGAQDIGRLYERARPYLEAIRESYLDRGACMMAADVEITLLDRMATEGDAAASVPSIFDASAAIQALRQYRERLRGSIPVLPDRAEIEEIAFSQLNEGEEPFVISAGLGTGLLLLEEGRAPEWLERAAWEHATHENPAVSARARLLLAWVIASNRGLGSPYRSGLPGSFHIRGEIPVMVEANIE